MRLLKFGGTSVKSADRISNVVEILKGYFESNVRFAAVFSALGGVTDEIIKMSQDAAAGNAQYITHLEQFKARHITAIDKLLEGSIKDKVHQALQVSFIEMGNLLQGVFLVKDLTKRTQDYLLSFGERNSAYIIAHALIQNGVPAAYLDARKVVKTDANFGSAKVNFSTTNALIQEHFQGNQEVQIITGFVSSTTDGITTTLGRGGSDYTAAIFAAALDADEIEIWTDVDGVMTADPRKVKKAFSLEHMTYAEAMEMSHFGAKVIYPPTIQPALQKTIPIRIKNTFNPDFAGTLISKTGLRTRHAVKGISSISNVDLVTLEGSGLVGVKGTAARLFSTLAQNNVNIIMITQGSSEYSINFAINPNDAKRAKNTVEEEFELEMQAGYIKPLRVEKDLCIVAAIGENMRYEPGIAGRVFQALGVNGINIVAIAQGSSELNISTVINRSNEAKAINAIHEAFFLSDTKAINLFIVGVGLIGGTLLEQIAKQKSFLAKERQLEIKVVGLANSRIMLFNEDGINLDSWQEDLSDSGITMEIDGYINTMKGMNLPNTIFLDNTADKRIPEFYTSILDASISISTPNKVATSSDFQHYLALKTLARKRGVGFMYETNVGAGLPVITTLTDLISSGDNILKIEGVLSGSLSFIFNSFKKGVAFSEIVKQAQEKGYTEPDPREDLSGADVSRKLLILARETGLPYEKENIKIKGILPQECLDAPTVDDFFTALKANDDHFENLREAAEANGSALRFIASLDNGEATISLQEVDNDHPFYGLSGSDNMIVFTTERYKERPLVVRGPGAGAEVTAAGVFAEIISISNRYSR
ncbi:MAG: bifunctional aspartate kinase/homoserine dehydrogenase I [Bacteroidota bacterium]